MNENTPSFRFNENTEQVIAPFVSKMYEEDMSDSVIKLFSEYVQQFLNSQSVGFIPESTIEPVQEADVKGQNQLTAEDEEIGRVNMEQAIAIKLNGGLG